MKRFSILCLLAFVALCGITSCKEDPAEFNNIPTLHLQEPTDLLRTSVTLHGSILTSYPQHIEEYGFLFSSSIDFSSSDTQRLPIEAASLADISVNLSNLEIGETYFYLLYATGADELQSDVHSITMPMRSGATLSEVEVLDLYTPTLKARITDDGGSTITSVGFCWSTSPNPTIFTGEHEFATYDEESQSFTADLTKLKGREDYYIRAFAECDVTGGGDVSISYGEVGTLALKHKVTLEAINATTTTLTFALTPFNCDEVKWLVVPQPEAGGITADKVFSEGTSANATQRSEVTAENLRPETTYAVYAVAEAEGEALLCDPIELTTELAPTIELEMVNQDYTTLTFAITSANAEEVKYLFLSEDEVATAGEITAEKVLAEGSEIEANKRVQIKKQELTTETTFYVYAAARIETAITSVASLELFTATTPQTWRIYYTSTDEKIVEPNYPDAFEANIISNTYEDGQGEIIFDGEVTKIGGFCFNNNKMLKTIVIPNGVHSIEVEAFRDCANLEDITISDGVEVIEYGAFSFCKGLTKITLPNTITTIEEQVFQGCENLMAFYGQYASEDNRCLIKDGKLLYFAPKNLTNYTIPNDVTAICPAVFEGCGNLTEIIIPDGVTTIGSGAFVCCTALKSMVIPHSVKTIGASAFYYCLELEEITLSENLTVLEDRTFEMCINLKTITIPEAITSIGSLVFSCCDRLESMHCQPTTPPTLGESAFEAVPETLKIYVPYISYSGYKTKWSSYADKITYLESEIPESCKIYYTSLDENVVNPHRLNAFGANINIVSNTYENGRGEILFDGPVTEIGFSAFYECSYLKNITIPDGVTSIGESAFRGCGLTSITIPVGVTSIGGGAFYECTGLTSVTIPDSVTEIGSSAFQGCTSLTSVTIPDSVTSIEDWAFQGCSGLTSVTIPDSVTSIGTTAFAECYQLTAFYGKYASEDNRCLIVNGVLNSFAPSGLTKYTIPDGVTKIEEYAFFSCVDLTSITIPDGVTSIGERVFQCCVSLTDITIPNSVISIGMDAFSDCFSLTSITIPNSVTSIGERAFYNCIGLKAFYGKYASLDNRCLIVDGVLKAFAIGCSATEYTIPDSVTEIGNSAFFGCEGLTSITIPDSVTSIEDSAFSSCTGLTSVTIGNSVTTIGREAFRSCSNLTSATIGNGVTSIEDYAFSGCYKLTSVYCKPTTPPKGGSNMFNYNASGRKIYVPNESVDTYKNATYWSDYASSIVGYDF